MNFHWLLSDIISQIQYTVNQSTSQSDQTVAAWRILAADGRVYFLGVLARCNEFSVCLWSNAKWTPWPCESPVRIKYVCTVTVHWLGTIFSVFSTSYEETMQPRARHAFRRFFKKHFAVVSILALSHTLHIYTISKNFQYVSVEGKTKMFTEVPHAWL
jgi:hypothetical protein